MSKLSVKRFWGGLTRNSILLAFASFFGDISTEMLYPVLPIYLTETLKSGGSIVGIVEGVAQATQNIIQGFSGYMSDRWQKRKPIALAGYLLSALSKPFIGIATAWPGVLAARFFDRLGAGTRSAPRDALIAASVDEKNRGKAFGLEGIGDNLGAFIGPLITVLFLFLFKFNIRYIFYWAIVPGLLAFIMTALVKEKKNGSVKAKINLKFKQFPIKYWKFLIAIAVFGLGNSSSSFLILQIKDNGFTLVDTVLVYAMYNLAAAFISYPAGFLSDLLGRRIILLITFASCFIAYTGFAFNPDNISSILLFILYGFYQGMFRAVGKSYAADFVGEGMRASSIGWYATVVGLTGLIANIIAGMLWDKIGHTLVFVWGAVFSALGILFFIVLTFKDSNNKYSG